ncbi:Fur family transcriptional regulator [Pseudoruegeria sp. HB172150]|uniref:Fur family transcriptional regulator n=1 Tax=Pseudoruegeria sp. HB172150 TaxID=2721164 RepID=UPI0020A6377A|nr:Fur family transcriptional regulator [Pseudoruegeria sp. HB172150]
MLLHINTTSDWQMTARLSNGDQRSEYVSAAILAAQEYCRDNRLQFTDTRRRVLEILLEAELPLGAYAILSQLNDEGFGSQPPVAYRALDFLESNGFVHKVDRLAAYVACANPHQPHSPSFLICRNCGSVQEARITSPHRAVRAAARAGGFRIERESIEAVGICASCSSSGH